jgi:AcrR family transcriptional regulator
MGRPSKKEERRAEILAAFESCVVAKGFELTTLADVGAAAGQPRSLVRHFIGNRDQMVVALIDRLLERAMKQIETLPKHGSIDQAMTLLMERVFDDPTTNIVIMELWHVALRDGSVRKRLADVYGGFIVRVTAMLTDGRPDSEIHQRVFSATATAFGAAFFRYLGLLPPSPDQLSADVRALLVGKLPPAGSAN